MTLSRGSLEGSNKEKHASWIISIQKALIIRKGLVDVEEIHETKEERYEGVEDYNNNFDSR